MFLFLSYKHFSSFSFFLLAQLGSFHPRISSSFIYDVQEGLMSTILLTKHPNGLPSAQDLLEGVRGLKLHSFSMTT